MTDQSVGNGELEALLEHIRSARGFDFTGYKRSSLMRRVRKRMAQVGVQGFSDYMDYLEVHPEEFTNLFNTILINVTSFFRDPPAWDYLAEHILPRIIESKAAHEPIRIWSAGCASGEEAYSLAMLLADALGQKEFQERVKIYATDIDEDALAQARQAVYTQSDIEAVPEGLRERYFVQNGTRCSFRPDLRRAVIFGRHDLVQDAPISRIDLLSCRNTLMYFNAETQGRILRRFHFALNDGGFLFLGRAEMLLTHAKLFTPAEMKHRIFTKTISIPLRERIGATEFGDQEANNQLGRQVRLLEAAFDALNCAQVVIDEQGHLALANECARNYFGLVAKDQGRPLQDLEISYRPVELRSLIERAFSERRSIQLR
ncbi:MAG TPA: CheR family methyltransferase, partial [Candidatus Obscuribacterales bacterium]